MLVTYRQWRSHTSGVRGVRNPVRKIHIFWYVIFLSVIGLRVKPSGRANIFVN